MKITIRKPLGYSQIGRKDQQEDAVWPLFSDVSADNPCIVLCDGVGGSEHGEVASQTSSKVIGEYLTAVAKSHPVVTEDDVNAAVNLAYDELERIDTGSSENGSVSMATTLTCVCLHEDGILAAHMGDSRIYQIRPGVGLLYQSSDHSLVNALLQAGELTMKEAKTFPRKNVITKAIQPHGNKRFNAEAHQLTDVKAGDYLFLCCDGVLEQLTNQRLVEILSMSCSNAEKIQLLEAESTGKTKDNYTAYLIPIEKVEGESSIVQDDEVAVTMVETEANDKTMVSPKPVVVESVPGKIVHPQAFPTEGSQIVEQEPTTKKKQSWLVVVIALLTLSIVVLLIKHFNIRVSFGEDAPVNIEEMDTIHKVSIDSIKSLL